MWCWTRVWKAFHWTHILFLLFLAFPYIYNVLLNFVTRSSRISECLTRANLPHETLQGGKERFRGPSCNPAKQGFLGPAALHSFLGGCLLGFPLCSFRITWHHKITLPCTSIYFCVSNMHEIGGFQGWEYKTIIFQRALLFLYKQYKNFLIAMHCSPQIHLFRRPHSGAISNLISPLYSPTSKPLESKAWEIIIFIPEERSFKIPLHLVG